MSTVPPESPPKWDDETYGMARKIVEAFGFVRPEHREDVLHDYVLKNPQLAGFSGKSKLSTWLYSCLRNYAVDWARKKYHLRKEPENRPTYQSLDEEHDQSKEDSPCPYDMKTFVLDASLVTFAPGYEFFPHCKHDESSEFLQRSIKDFKQHVLECDECEQRYVLFKKDPTAYLFTTAKIYEEKPMSSFQEVLDLQRQLEEKKQGVIQGLLKQQDEINKQLSELGYGQTVQAKGRRVCSNCGKPGHNAKTCTEPKKHANSHKKEHN